jgi:hypothetical protein
MVTADPVNQLTPYYDSGFPSWDAMYPPSFPLRVLQPWDLPNSNGIYPLPPGDRPLPVGPTYPPSVPIEPIVVIEPDRDPPGRIESLLDRILAYLKLDSEFFTRNQKYIIIGVGIIIIAGVIYVSR